MSLNSSNDVGRRTFLQRLGMAALGAGSAMTSTGFALQKAVDRFTSANRGVADRPFHIVAFGDSIMWGQGLAENQKFANIVKDWVQSQLPGRSVTLHNFAHSGAIIEPNFVHDVNKFGGEVPSSWPSINGQVWQAIDELKPQFPTTDVDLVLLDGGINDVDLRNILKPGSGEDTVRALTRDRLGTRMKYLLPIVTGTFPSAKVVVTGYFQILSDDSSVDEIAAALVAMGLFFTAVAPAAVALWAWAKKAMVEQCIAFDDEARAQLTEAVRIENARTPDRCIFADPSFAPVHAYGASARRLFKIGEEDPAKSLRFEQCKAAGNEADVLCIDASMGHPNVAGAQAYATAITSRLARFVPKWQGLRQMLVCIEPAPVLGQLKTYTVWAEDAETHSPVAGTVSIPSASTAFATNAPFSHTFAPCTSVTEKDCSPNLLDKTICKKTTEKVCEDYFVMAPGYINWTAPVQG